MLDAELPSNYWNTATIKLPELKASKSVTQRNNQSVYEHTMTVIDLLTKKTPVTLLSGLFHDLGKSTIMPMNDLSLPRFPGHSEESADIAERRLSQWGTNADLIDRVVRLVTTHMYDISRSIRPKSIRKFVADVGRDNIDDWFILRIADSRSYSNQDQYRSYFIDPFRVAVMSYIDDQPENKSPQIEPIGQMHIEGSDRA